MREIIFRGKSVNDGKWHEGSYIAMRKSSYIADVQFQDIEEIKIEKAMEEVDPESLGQFTGIVDQHGTKIFEGDICEVTYPYEDDSSVETVVVVWSDFGHRFQLKTPKGNAHSFCGNIAFKIIGSIIDDPELLVNSENQRRMGNA